MLPQVFLLTWIGLAWAYWVSHVQSVFPKKLTRKIIFKMAYPSSEKPMFPLFGQLSDNVSTTLSLKQSLCLIERGPISSFSGGMQCLPFPHLSAPGKWFYVTGLVPTGSFRLLNTSDLSRCSLSLSYVLPFKYSEELRCCNSSVRVRAGRQRDLYIMHTPTHTQTTWGNVSC